MKTSGAIADLFSDLPEVRETGEAAVAQAFASLVTQPGWTLLKDYVQRVREAKALLFATGAARDTHSVEATALDAAYTQGYLAGLSDAVVSAEQLVKVQYTKQSEEEDEPRHRGVRFSRGGING